MRCYKISHGKNYHRGMLALTRLCEALFFSGQQQHKILKEMKIRERLGLGLNPIPFPSDIHFQSKL